MAVIQAQDICFSYYGYQKEIFRNLNFCIDSDWKTGLVGRNGIGKSTLLRILMGELEYQGRLHTSQRFEYFPMRLDLEQTAYEVFVQRNESYEIWRMERELHALQMDPETLCRPLATLSKGEQSKVQLALLFVNGKDFLLIDEPTNHLDIHARQVVSDYLRRKSGFILVSHDRNFLDTCVDHILALNKSSVEVISGNFSTWYYQKTLRNEAERSRNEKLKKEIKDLHEAAQRNRRFADKVEATKFGSGSADRGYIGHQSARMMQRALAIERRVERAAEEKSQLLKDVEYQEQLKLWQEEHPKNVLIAFEDVSVRYAGKTVAEHISFTLCNGDCLALIGANGSGKSSILKLILGENIDHDGSIRVVNDLVISYVPQDSSGLYGRLEDWIAEERLDHTLLKTILRKLGFGRELFDTRLESYSEGQKKKLLIATSLAKKANMFIWDEPMNYIDLLSRIQIEDILLEYRPTLIFVEHDAAFCDKIATKRLCL